MKRILIFFCCAAVLMSCVTLSLAADTPDTGTVNSTALNYFTGVVNKLPANTDYVIYKTGDYTTAMVYGQLEYSSSSFAGSDVTYLLYNTRGQSFGTSYIPTYSASKVGSYSLSFAEDNILYSNLGDFAQLGDSGRDNVSYILWSIIFLILIFIVYKHFRNRRQYINL